MLSRRPKLKWCCIAAIAGLASSGAVGEVVVFTDQGAYEASMITSTVVDFEGVPEGEIIPRYVGHAWGTMTAGVNMYQVDAEANGYYGTPYLSDFLASTLYSQPILLEFAAGTNAVGGQWFHAQDIQYDGHFTVTLADNSTFAYVYEDIATGRELNEPDFCGFICTDQDIASVHFTCMRNGGPAVSMTDNVNHGYGVPIEDCPADVNFDDTVDIDDLFAVLGVWGPCDDCPEDITEDGYVDIDDVFAVLGNWGPCP